MVSWIAFLATAAVLYLASCNDENAAKFWNLKSPESFAKFSPSVWNINDDGSLLKASFSFKTRSRTGRIATVTAENDGKLIFALATSLENGSLSASMNNGEGFLWQRKIEGLTSDASTGVEQLVSLLFDTEHTLLQVLVSDQLVDSEAFDNFEIAPESLQLSVIFGKFEETDGIKGCIALSSLNLGDKVVANLSNAENAEVEPGCPTLCANYNCNTGKCMELLGNAVCDCRGTSKSGNNCEQDAPTVSLAPDTYLAYNLTGYDPEIQSIELEFKTSAADGVILHGDIVAKESLEPLGKLKLSMVEGQLKLTIGDFAGFTFEDVKPSTDRFHRVTLEFNYADDAVTITFGESKKIVSWSDETTNRDIRFQNAIYFSAGDSETGIPVCLRGVYIGHVDVISSYNAKSLSASSNEPLESCPADVPAVNKAPPLLLAVVPPVEVKKPENVERNEEPMVDIEDVVEGINEDVVIPPEDDMVESDRNEMESDRQDDSAGSSAPVDCDNSQKANCQNFENCTVINGQITCGCQKGFIGKYCEFSTWPQNCDDVLASGETASGVFEIDVDGSGPLPKTYVDCKDGITIVPHNMPEKVPIKDPLQGHRKLLVNYRLFSEAQLDALRATSAICKQTLTYECVNAPLGLHEKQTWFKSTDDTTFAEFSNADGTCVNVDGHYDRCRCDTDSPMVDRGILEGKHAPLTSLVSLVKNTMQAGHASLSPFECSGGAGRTYNHTAKFRNPTGVLPLGLWKGRSLSFEFRTYSGAATLMSTMEENLHIELDDRHLKMDLMHEEVTITSQSRLNDGKWHRVLVEVLNERVRFSVDGLNQILFLQVLITNDLNLRVGGARGYLGCMRRIIIDNSLKELGPFIEGNIASASLGCDDQCINHRCYHDSKCIEDFEKDEPVCVCSNNITITGKQCEHNINVGGEISLRSHKKGFLKIKNPLPSAMTERVVFSVKTDARDALLLYLHDHLYNFIQIHLADYSKMILTLNMNHTISRCIVEAKIGKEYNRMHWVQIMLFQLENRIVLNVDDETCEIEGPRILSAEFITNYYASSIDDIVVPPVSPGQTAGSAYIWLFMGGVPLESGVGRLEPIYNSKLPNLLGCLRGLMIGSSVFSLQDNSYWAYYNDDPDAVQIGCETQCEEVEKLCEHGGHCTYKWTSQNPDEQRTTCDCTRTSYYGDHCNHDSGIAFDGASMLLFNAGPIIDSAYYQWSLIGEQTMSFAFSGNPSDATQHLATIIFSQNRMLEILLNKNGSVHVGIISDGPTYVTTLGSSFNNGYRHFIQAAFNQKNNSVIMVDSKKVVIPPSVAKGLSLPEARRYYFGGIEHSALKDQDTSYTGPAEDVIPKQNFTGCISNIDIDLHIGNFHFNPILSYQNPSNHLFSEHVSAIGDTPTLQACAAFEYPGIVTAQRDPVSMPAWEAPFVNDQYVLATNAPVPIGDATPAPAKKGSSFWWIIAVIVVVLLLIILIVLLILFCLKKKAASTPTGSAPSRRPAQQAPPLEPKNDGNSPTQPELVPLIPLQGAPPERPERPTKIRNNYDVPEPNHPLSDAPPDYPPPPKVSVSTVTSYYTAQESFDSDDLATASQGSEDLDVTLKDYDEDTILADDDLRGFNRSQPQRLSSFRRGDPTAPIDSPLYKRRMQRGPKPVLPPHSPA